VAKFCAQLAALPAAGKVVGRHSTKVLKALLHAIVADRSPVIRHAMAAAAARVAARPEP
jgi:hypothetical protein